MTGRTNILPHSGSGTAESGRASPPKDLPAVFDRLRSLDYAGDFILQVARDSPGDEVRWARQNLERIHAYLSGAEGRGA